jgi:hypothetical protein
MSSSPPSSKIQTPPSSTGFRSTRPRVPVKRDGYANSGDIEDPDNVSDEDLDYDLEDGDFVEEKKGKRSRSSEDDDEEDSQVSLHSFLLFPPRSPCTIN